jgi:CheY-like chemotaxis protein
VIHDMLEIGGMDVISVDGGEAALSSLERRKFDVVVTDLTMPGMGGIELAVRVKELHPDLPVVLMSGRATEQVEEEIREARIDHVLQKPFEIASLVGVIAGHAKRGTKG